MKNVKVRDFRDKVFLEALTVKKNTHVLDIIELFLKEKKRSVIFVVDNDNKYSGYITPLMLNDSLSIEFGISDDVSSQKISSFYGLMGSKEYAHEIMEEKPLCLYDDQSIADAMLSMKQNSLLELPVLDESENIIGGLHFLEVLEFWKENLKK